MFFTDQHQLLVLRQTFFQTAANGVNHPLPGKGARFPDIRVTHRRQA